MTYIPTYALQEIGLDELTASDLRAEVDELRADAKRHGVGSRPDDEPVESIASAYRITLYGEGGYAKGGSVVQMLYVIPAGRASIYAGGDSDWTDASSPEDAVGRWLRGEITG